MGGEDSTTRARIKEPFPQQQEFQDERHGFHDDLTNKCNNPEICR